MEMEMEILNAGSEHVLATEEWLASRVLEHVADAREVCRLALININFWAASLSDLVWQNRLPPKSVLDAVFTPTLYSCPSKKDLYMHLCKSISYENGLKKFWLDPASGGECYMISARALSIAWGDTPKYWGWKAWPSAMFPEVAILHLVFWFEIKGTFRQTLRPGKYMLSYRMQKNSQAVGWQRSPIKLCLQNTTYAHPPHLSQGFFEDLSLKTRSWSLPQTPQTTATSDIEALVHQRGRVSLGRHNISNNEHESADSSSSSGLPHKWVECDAGEFLVEDDNEGRPIEVQFSMQEIVGRWSKDGFVLDGVIIRPCYVVENATIE